MSAIDPENVHLNFGYSMIDSRTGGTFFMDKPSKKHIFQLEAGKHSLVQYRFKPFGWMVDIWIIGAWGNEAFKM
jgi:hypothetical protein